ncbi:polyprenyl synthetase family protein [Propioniciclava coleopterorum]|uniref:Polyprenyl synthetase family protein n=1 Tax=Propioniciclava coleopterorum TaxID=2714937 RepID=A0A6G7Y899_9ACTN|nr:polyprenyl synthetase family protein [Propioniciclava coleopterorum]QIK72939.1 polyprenyl synthetase family protein [Propioniciclava coleopterorum]
MVTLAPDNPVSDDVRAAVGGAIDAFLDEQAGVLSGISPTTSPLLKRSRMFTAGGKRLRPAFALWAWAAITGELTPPEGVVRAAASLDVLHVSALMHDDVMDASDARRGVPAAHRQFEADHRERAWRGDPEAFGRAGGILLGDLLLVWSQEMFRRSGLDADALARAYPHLEAVRTEVTAGQYLDVLAQARDPYPLTRTEAGRIDLAQMISTVVTWKSASYSVRRPLLVGAAAAGADEAQLAALTAFGQPLGRAFQYRDDVLGIFGDEALTGKESGEDLREGKLTLLAAEAFGRASEADAAELAGLFGAPDLTAAQVERARAIIAGGGALDAVEAEIEREYDAALAALAAAPVTEPGRDGLAAMARVAVRRTF